MRVFEAKFMPSHHQDILLNSYPLTKRWGQWQQVKTANIHLERIKQTVPEINLQNLGWQQNNCTSLLRFLVSTVCQRITHKVLQQLTSLVSLASPEHWGPKPTRNNMVVFTFKRPHTFVYAHWSLYPQEWSSSLPSFLDVNWVSAAALNCA